MFDFYKLSYNKQLPHTRILSKIFKHPFAFYNASTGITENRSDHYSFKFDIVAVFDLSSHISRIRCNKIYNKLQSLGIRTNKQIVPSHVLKNFQRAVRPLALKNFPDKKLHRSLSKVGYLLIKNANSVNIRVSHS